MAEIQPGLTRGSDVLKTAGFLDYVKRDLDQRLELLLAAAAP